MPVSFLTAEQERRYGRYAGEPTPDQLARHFHLDDADRDLATSKRWDHMRLGFAVQLGTVRFLGTFLDDPVDVPAGVAGDLARQLGIADPGCLTLYREGWVRWQHAREIRAGFSPRLADIGGTRFWRVDGKADYGALDGLAAQRVNVALVIQHWEDLLRLTGSLKLGTVQAAGLIRTLQTKDRPTKLARALEELGRLIKTLYLLRFIDDAAYRRRILVQLNRGEGRHQLARIVFHGKRGELRQRYREGQEDQLGALGLVVNVIVLWNTIYMDAALNQHRDEGFDVRAEDVARLSPLGFDHINMLGRYAFILPDGIARGELRPLRDPRHADEEG